MENLVMERVKLMGSTAPRRGSDPIKPDHRPTYRFALELFLELNIFLDPRWKVWGWKERSAGEVQRQGGGEAKPSKASDKHSGYKKKTFRHSDKKSNIQTIYFDYSLVAGQKGRVKLKTGKKLSEELLLQFIPNIFLDSYLKVDFCRFSAKEGGRQDGARPKTSMQVV